MGGRLWCVKHVRLVGDFAFFGILSYRAGDFVVVFGLLFLVRRLRSVFVRGVVFGLWIVRLVIVNLNTNKSKSTNGKPNLKRPLTWPQVTVTMVSLPVSRPTLRTRSQSSSGRRSRAKLNNTRFPFTPTSRNHPKKYAVWPTVTAPLPSS